LANSTTSEAAFYLQEADNSLLNHITVNHTMVDVFLKRHRAGCNIKI